MSSNCGGVSGRRRSFVFFALVDGENAIPLESAQDHKRVGDGDTGPNTGGMGTKVLLSGVSLDWSKDSAMVVVMASKGYLGAYEKGSIIRNLEEAEKVAPGVKIFHAGTDVIQTGMLYSEWRTCSWREPNNRKLVEKPSIQHKIIIKIDKNVRN